MLNGRYRAATGSQRTRALASRVKGYPAPTRGWIANENLAASTPQGAAILENWFPTATGVRMRFGSELWATLDNEALPVTALWTYANGSNRKLFAANEEAIYDATVPLAPSNTLFETDVDGVTLTDGLGNDIGMQSFAAAAVSGLTGGDWVSVQFQTPGGVFLRLVNGVDDPLVYDGSAFSTSPAITGVTGGAETLSYVWSFKNRLWFIKGGTLDAYYLDNVDAIGGAASEFPLGAVFALGGSLMFGASWSLDENSGLSASCVFVTTEGEVAVYQGSNPASATDWALKGVYRIGRPLGPHAWIRAGGDVIIATDIGFVPLSQAIQRDVAALAPASVSYPIEVAWNEAVAARPGYWVAEIWPTKQMSIVIPPAAPNERDEMFVANARTGAWCNFTGLTGRCSALFDGRMYVGTTGGRVIELERTGSDLGSPYTAVCAPLFDNFNSAGRFKAAGLARAVMLADQDPQEVMSAHADYVIELPPAPDAFAPQTGGAWGGAVWGSSTWGAKRTKRIWQSWRGVAANGFALTAAVQVTSGAVVPPDIDLIRLDVSAQIGEAVV